MPICTELERIQLLVRRNCDLPALPRALTALVRAIDRGDASVIELERIISSDPLLATDFLRLAHGMEGTPHHPSTTVRVTILRLGFRAVRSLAVSIMLKRAFARGKVPDCFDRDAFSSTSVATAILSRYLFARKVKVDGMESAWSADDIFSAGLLANLGTALLATVAPETFTRCYLLGQRHNVSIPAAFALICGAPLSSLAGLAVQNWQLPEAFQVIVSNLETPWIRPDEQGAISCVSMARQIAGDFGYRIEKWACPVDLPIEVSLDISIPDQEKVVLATNIQTTIDAYFSEPLAA